MPGQTPPVESVVGVKVIRLTSDMLKANQLWRYFPGFMFAIATTTTASLGLFSHIVKFDNVS